MFEEILEAIRIPVGMRARGTLDYSGPVLATSSNMMKPAAREVDRSGEFPAGQWKKLGEYGLWA